MTARAPIGKPHFQNIRAATELNTVRGAKKSEKKGSSLAVKILDSLSRHKKSYSVLDNFEKTPFHIAPRQYEWANGSIYTA